MVEFKLISFLSEIGLISKIRIIINSLGYSEDQKRIPPNLMPNRYLALSNDSVSQFLNNEYVKK